MDDGKRRKQEGGTLAHKSSGPHRAVLVVVRHHGKLGRKPALMQQEIVDPL